MIRSAHYDLLVIGGGAAGFFGAIQTAACNPALRILILEKSTKLLSKVKISGGGRCNVTHACKEPTALSKHYPRGQKELKKLFYQFNAVDTVAWFGQLQVNLKTEPDGRIFPQSNNSQTIIDCFLREAEKYKIEIKTGCEVTHIANSTNHLTITCKDKTFTASKVLVATGGYTKPENYNWLAAIGHTIVEPIPSLFTFNEPEQHFASLMGVAVPHAEVKIAGTRFSQQGPVLITHWGLSGPAVIKLSAWAAVTLHQLKYTFTALVNWAGQPELTVRNTLMALKQHNNKKNIAGNPLFDVPKRLWEFLTGKAGIAPEKIWADASHKEINRLIELLCASPFSIKGKTTFKEEFVTCGGIDWSELDLATMESKLVPGLYFAGEVINTDGETGGFNFQAAWTTAWVAAQAIGSVEPQKQSLSKD
ncbi:MAG: NAD(P)/FAD-dependent oxidoreductase [Cyclobacteriaceae bacterium]|nr:NAD(P)/FAD-dependent oxidoreductase [Cyclobacteriaceae bacterium]